MDLIAMKNEIEFHVLHINLLVGASIGLKQAGVQGSFRVTY